MEKFKGTPGKWSVAMDNTVIDENGFSVAEADSVYRILDNYTEKTGHGHWSGHEGETYINVSDEEATANAQLIATAPELLEALQKVLKDVEANQLWEYVDHVGIMSIINKALTPHTNRGLK